MYLIKDRKPYFTDGKKIYKCEITKDYAKVDFGETVRAFPFDCVYALEEIKKLLLGNADIATSFDHPAKKARASKKG